MQNMACVAIQLFRSPCPKLLLEVRRATLQRLGSSAPVRVPLPKAPPPYGCAKGSQKAICASTHVGPPVIGDDCARAGTPTSKASDVAAPMKANARTGGRKRARTRRGIHATPVEG